MSIHDLVHRLIFGAKVCSLSEREQFEQEARALQNRVAKLQARVLELELAQPPRPRFDRRPAWSDSQIRDVLGGTAPTPVVQAVTELIDVKFQEATDQALGPQVPDSETKYHLGGADWILRLKQELQRCTEAPKEGESGPG